jgi:predicted acetyltransferase
MSEVRPLMAEDFAAATQIFAEAYPGMKIVSAKDREALQERLLRFHESREEDPTAAFYGLFRDGDLMGIMVLYEFEMNFHGAPVPIGGVGQVAVALPHKKEHVCKEMIRYFLRRCRERGVPLTALYPFRPDFYRNMGFGYGSKMDQYCVKPLAFPKGPSKAGVRNLTAEDKPSLRDCYARVAGRTHGMMRKTEREMRQLFGKAENRLVGYEEDGKIRGYLVYTWEHGGSFIVNDLHIREFVYETRDALSALCTYLHSQDDQVRNVVLNTQDEHFYHLLLDPRNGSDRLIPPVYHETNAQGVGLMYRVVDTPGIFDLLGERDFGGQTCRVKLTVADSFLPENAGSSLLQFERGRLRRQADCGYDVELSLAIEDFSSMLAGTASLGSLYRYGRASLSDPAYLDTLHRIFAVERKPVCTTDF